ncbi:hypothetical protein SAMN05216251_101383 [Actinacidiphila alni]|uniref:Uncharacterized protein n=1 Tax=Actinacidiphila alni TaxID=380248 RepID=A0A1I1XH28_9ACTN|nr:hypothetical protein [Actinacidiphila alni]SFE06709.1 hypothetical protein SAMN05216251_101383 [Actinacidiphila alni]
MTATRTRGGAPKAGTSGTSGAAALAAARDLALLDDAEFGVRLLRATGLHPGRTDARLRSWARSAAAYGAGLPARTGTARIVESDGGLAHGLLARYTTRPPTVELFTDVLARAERLVDDLSWRAWFPPGSVREAALAHEAVHEQLHHGPGRAALRRALGHRLLSLGGRALYGHVAGAEEIAAHAHAQAVCSLGRSPLLLTAALDTVLDSATAGPPAGAAESGPAAAHNSPSPPASPLRRKK